MAIDITGINMNPGGNHLAAWEIHKVKLVNVTHENTNGKDGKVYHTMIFTYENKDGLSFSHMLFCPFKAEDPEGCTRQIRPENQYADPSKEEVFITTIALAVNQILGDSWKNRFNAFYPSKADPVKGQEQFNKFCTAVEKMFKENAIDKGLELQLKLIGDKNNYARVPSLIGIKKDGGLFYRSVFVARADDKELTFTNDEMKYRDKLKANGPSSKSAGPSKVSDDIDMDIDTVAASSGMSEDDLAEI